MFCEKCGKPIPEGKDSCEFCNPTAQQEVEYQIPPVAEEAEMPEFTLTMPAEENEKPKKAGKLGLIIGAAALVLAVLLVALNWKPISRFFVRTFAAPETYLAVVEKDAAADVAENIAAAYDKYMNSYSSDGAVTDMEIKLEAGDLLLNVLTTALKQNGMALDLNWVESVTLSPTVEVYKNMTRADIGVGLNDTHLATISLVMDMDAGMVYVGIPELHKTYLSFEAEDIFGYEYEEVFQSMTQSQEMTKELMKLMPTGEELKTLINTYWGIVADSFADGEKETQKVSCGGLKQKLTVITVELSQKDVLKLAGDLLEQAQDDKIVKKLIKGFNRYATEMNGYDMDLYSQFDDVVDELLDDLDYMMDEAARGDFITIETFVDNKNTIVGRTITVETDGEEVEIYYITVTEGKEFAFQADIANRIVIEGEGTLDGDKRTGSYTLSVDGTEYVTLELEDFACTDNTLSGTVRIVPSSDLYSSTGGALSVVGILSTATLELTFDEDTVRLAVEVSGAEMIALTLSATSGKSSVIAIPESISNNATSAEGLKWMSEFDLDGLVNNLKKAGVPNDYMDLINGLIPQFRDLVG